MNCFSEQQLNRISDLVREIEKLSDVEKLFLYLQLPCGHPDNSEAIEGGKSSSSSKLNDSKVGPNSDLFAKKPDLETTQTYTWILSHLEVDPNVSLPKQEVYDEYKAFCQANRFEPLCVADFGKAMKHAFPCIKPRRLGQRGNSRYCYSGLRKKYKIQPPNLPDMMIEPTFCMDNDCSQTYNQIIKDCRDNPDECPLNNKPIFTVNEVINLKIEPNTGQYLSNGGGGGGGNNLNNCASGSTTYFNNGDNNSSKQHPNNIHPHQSQLHTNIQPTMTPAAAGAVAATGSHEYIPSNPIPISQPSSVRLSSYSGLIKQPGTPDDDDYQHNYHQDLLPINRNLYSAALNDPSHHHHHNHQHQHHQHHNNHHQHQESAPAGEGFSHLHHHHHHPSMKVTGGSSSLMDTNNSSGHRNHPNGSQTSDQQMLQPQASSSFANDPLVSGNAPSTGSGIAGCPEMLQFSHMNSSLIDSCASPFQSPASTPYHQIGSYMSPDIQDYYSTNDCMRYSS